MRSSKTNQDGAETDVRLIKNGGAAALQGSIVGAARIVERAIGLGPCALTEDMALPQDRLASAETRRKHDYPSDLTHPFAKFATEPPQLLRFRFSWL